MGVTPSHHPFRMMGFPWNKPSSYWGTTMTMEIPVFPWLTTIFPLWTTIFQLLTIGFPTSDKGPHGPTPWCHSPGAWRLPRSRCQQNRRSVLLGGHGWCTQRSGTQWVSVYIVHLQLFMYVLIYFNDIYDIYLLIDVLFMHWIAFFHVFAYFNVFMCVNLLLNRFVDGWVLLIYDVYTYMYRFVWNLDQAHSSILGVPSIFGQPQSHRFWRSNSMSQFPCLCVS